MLLSYNGNFDLMKNVNIQTPEKKKKRMKAIY